MGIKINKEHFPKEGGGVNILLKRLQAKRRNHPFTCSCWSALFETKIQTGLFEEFSWQLKVDFLKLI